MRKNSSFNFFTHFPSDHLPFSYPFSNLSGTPLDFDQSAIMFAPPIFSPLLETHRTRSITKKRAFSVMDDKIEIDGKTIKAQLKDVRDISIPEAFPPISFSTLRIQTFYSRMEEDFLRIPSMIGLNQHLVDLFSKAGNRFLSKTDSLMIDKPSPLRSTPKFLKEVISVPSEPEEEGFQSMHQDLELDSLGQESRVPETSFPVQNEGYMRMDTPQPEILKELGMDYPFRIFFNNSHLLPYPLHSFYFQ